MYLSEKITRTQITVDVVDVAVMLVSHSEFNNSFQHPISNDCFQYFSVVAVGDSYLISESITIKRFVDLEALIVFMKLTE